MKASETVGKVLKDGDIVIYENTVYPDSTEEDYVPLLKRELGKKKNEHFFVGDSPKRINPGDQVFTLTTIKKVTSGSTPKTRQEVDALYPEIILTGRRFNDGAGSIDRRMCRDARPCVSAGGTSHNSGKIPQYGWTNQTTPH